MLGLKSKEQKEYSLKLKNEINSFTVNFNKRLKLYPSRTITRILRIKDVQSDIITIDKIEYTPKELVKKINQTILKLKSQSRNSYFNYVVTGFLKETNNKKPNEIKLIYNDYSNQLKVVFKDMQLDLSFCMDGLKEINILLKNRDKNYKESEETTTMLGYVTLESSEELDLRDFYLECYNDVLFSESVEDDIYDDFNEVQTDIKKQIKNYKKALKKNDFTGAKNAIRAIKSNLKKIVNAIKTVDKIDKNTVTSLIRSTNIVIKSMVIVIPNSGSLSSLIELLRDEKNKNDEIEDENPNKVITQAINSIKMLSKVCDAMEKEVKDREAEFKKNSKEVKEAVEYDAKRLSIYESCRNGEITVEEREELLQTLSEQRFVNESVELEEGLSNKQKFELVKKTLYERCANGEFNVDQRESLIEEAYNMIFNETEEMPTETPDEIVTPGAGDPPEKEEPDTTEDAESNPDINPEEVANEIETANNKLVSGLSKINIPTV